ncbi:hypothetical protein A3Q56_04509, partial [Intoshia linei]
MKQLDEDFVKGCLSKKVDNNIEKYYLNFSKLNLTDLKYSFDWFDNGRAISSSTSFTQNSKLVVYLNISYNLLEYFDHSHVNIFDLREIDLSINRLTKIDFVDYDNSNLIKINASYNNLANINLHDSIINNLVDLNLNCNDIRNVSCLVVLKKLKILNISNNKIDNLDKFNQLSHLTKLTADKNRIKSILPITVCLKLEWLSLSHNNLTNLIDTTESLSGLKELKTAFFYGNEIERNVHYHNEITNNTNIILLDNVPVRPLDTLNNISPSNHMTVFKKLAKQVYEGQIKARREQVEDQIKFYHNRIASIQNDFNEYSKRIYREFESCMGLFDEMDLSDDNKYLIERAQRKIDSIGKKKPELAHRLETDQ